MRILFLGKRYYTNKDALRERYGRIYQLPFRWHAAGQSVELVLIDYRGVRAEHTDVDGFPVHSLPMLTPMTCLRLRSLARQLRPDVIVASGDCFIGLAGLRLAQQFGASFVFDAYDDYRTFGAYRAFLGWDAFGYLRRHSTLVLYASRVLADEHCAAAAVHVVPNGVDPGQFRPIDRNVSRGRAALVNGDAALVGYFGGMDAERGVEDLVEAVGILNANGQSVRLVLCGPMRRGLTIDHPWVDWRGAVEHAVIPDFINACDVVVLPYRRGPIIDMASSCKIAEYLLCERPLVATDTPNFVRNFPRQAGELGAALCRPADPVDLARAIAMQLQRQLLVSRPDEHTWSRIAGDALVALERVTGLR